MTLKLLNRATTVLAASIGTSDTTLAVQASTGTKFPSLSPGDWFPLVVAAANGSYEIAIDDQPMVRRLEQPQRLSQRQAERVRGRVHRNDDRALTERDGDGIVGVGPRGNRRRLAASLAESRKTVSVTMTPPIVPPMDVPIMW